MPFYSMKNWKNRDVEFPGRRTLTDVLTSTSQTVDVARSEGTVTEAGDAFDASTMNDLEGRIGSAFTLVDGAKFDKPTNSPSEGQVVKYSSGSVVWANESGGGGGGDIIPFLPLCTVNGAIANFPDGANNIPIEACIADITPTQTGTGDPSPSNPRPITGFTECNILKTGKNMFDKTDSSIILQGFLTGSNTFRTGASPRTICLPCKPNTTYVISKVQSQRFAIASSPTIPNDNDPVNNYVSNNAGTSLSLTTSSTDNYLLAFVYTSDYDTLTLSEILATVQIELGSTATTYAEYQGESFEIAFGDTIYGGTLNATTGVLTATYAKTTFDGSEDWSVYSDYGMGFSVIISDMSSQNYGVGLSNVFTRVTSSTISSQSNGARFGANNKRLYVTQLNITGVSDLATWQTWLSNNDVYVVYSLATPLIIPLTTTAINTYYGVNNFSADTGDISVSYRTDIQLYIDKKIAEI